MVETFEARLDDPDMWDYEAMKRLAREADAELAAERAKVAEQAAHIDELVETQVYWMDQTTELRAKVAALEAERDALKAKIAVMTEAGNKMADALEDIALTFEHGRANR